MDYIKKRGTVTEYYLRIYVNDQEEYPYEWTYSIDETRLVTPHERK